MIALVDRDQEDGYAAAVDAYLIHMTALNRNRETMKLRRHHLNRWGEFCADRGVDALCPAVSEVEVWLAGLYRQHSQYTVHSHASSLRAFFRWHGDNDLFARIPSTKPKPPAIRPYSNVELRALLRVAEDNPRDKAVVLLLIGSGMRASELLGIRFTDIDWPSGTIRIIGKGDKPRRVCPGEAAMQALDEYVNECRRGFVFTGLRGPVNLQTYATGDRRGYVFPGVGKSGHLAKCSLWLLIERLAVAAGVSGGVHRFRHTFSHMFLANGGDIGDLRIILGHSSLHMTMRYAQYYEANRALLSQRLHNPADALLKGAEDAFQRPIS